MTRWLVACSLTLACAIGFQALFPMQATAQEGEPLTAERVGESINRGIRFLRRGQNGEGIWTRNAQHRGGVTALVTLSLLNSGVDPNDRMISKSIDYLDGLDLDRGRVSVYSVSLMTMVYAMARPESRQRIRECVQYLTDTQLTRGNSRGGWSYSTIQGRADSSNSQFALLALHEASGVGVEVDETVWRNAKWYWERVQSERSGGFYYTPNRSMSPPTGSMTCAGISSLIIVDENLDKPLPLKNGAIVCCGGNDRLEAVELANKWLAEKFSVRRNPAEGNTPFARNNLYYLYGMERAARLSGERFFGEHDWYREGADYMVRTQRGNGSWKGSSGHGETDENVATAFALLFLAKGRRPIVVGKYKHSDDNDWDRHRKGVHYLTRRLEKDWELKLNWQTIEGRFASTEDLLEAPVLFISGRDALRLDDRQKEALKKYVEYGGFIFAEACQGDGCGENVGFEVDFMALMIELFPESKLQLLEQSHPIFSAQYPLTVNPDRPMYGLQSSCRTSVVFCSRNLAGLWRLNRPSFADRLPERPKNQVEYATQLGVNVVAYATGQEVRDKLDRPKVIEESDEGLGQRIVLIPKLIHGGGSDDAPNAWQNIVRRARYDLKQRFKIERQMIAPKKEELSRYPMIFMHGRSKFSWKPEEQEALQEYFENGGFLFADTICSAKGFADAFRKEMKEVFPDNPLTRIPATDPIYSESGGGYQLDTIGMHRPDGKGTGVEKIKTAPFLEGIQVEGRWVVVFSPHDLSCAMENASALQCAGYDKDDAAKLGVNIILYVLKP